MKSGERTVGILGPDIKVALSVSYAGKGSASGRQISEEREGAFHVRVLFSARLCHLFLLKV